MLNMPCGTVGSDESKNSALIRTVPHGFHRAAFTTSEPQPGSGGASLRLITKQLGNIISQSVVRDESI